MNLNIDLFRLNRRLSSCRLYMSRDIFCRRLVVTPTYPRTNPGPEVDQSCALSGLVYVSSGQKRSAHTPPCLSQGTFVKDNTPPHKLLNLSRPPPPLHLTSALLTNSSYTVHANAELSAFLLILNPSPSHSALTPSSPTILRVACTMFL